MLRREPLSMSVGTQALASIRRGVMNSLIGRPSTWRPWCFLLRCSTMIRR